MPGLTIRELNPQPIPEHIPDYRQDLRFRKGADVVGVFREHPDSRRIPIADGKIFVRPGRTPCGAELRLPRPTAESQGGILHITNLTPRDVVLKISEDESFGQHNILRLAPPPGTPLAAAGFNGSKNILKLGGLGASVELFAEGDIWILVASNNAELR